MIAIVDYGVGNLHSVASALQYVGADTVVTADAGEIARADGIILPGVGAFPDAAASLAATGLIPVIREEVQKKPLLGICLGMQLLFTDSDEKRFCRGLDLIPGHIRRIETVEKLPQIGWNSLQVTNPCALTARMRGGEYVCFVHTYMAYADIHDEPFDVYPIVDWP